MQRHQLRPLVLTHFLSTPTLRISGGGQEPGVGAGGKVSEWKKYNSEYVFINLWTENAVKEKIKIVGEAASYWGLKNELERKRKWLYKHQTATLPGRYDV